MYLTSASGAQLQPMVACVLSRIYIYIYVYIYMYRYVMYIYIYV